MHQLLMLVMLWQHPVCVVMPVQLVRKREREHREGRWRWGKGG